MPVASASRASLAFATLDHLDRGPEQTTLKNLDWFEVKEIRGNIENGKVGWYQVTIDVGFRVLSPEDLRHQ